MWAFSLIAIYSLVSTRSTFLIVTGVIGICSYYLSYDMELTCCVIPLDFGLLSITLTLDDLGLWFMILLLVCCSWLVLSTVLKHSLSKHVDLLIGYIVVCSALFFLSGELLVMYCTFELITIPILIYVGLLGVSSRRVYALSVMVIYMLASSGIMSLVLFLYIDEFLDAQHISVALSRSVLSSDSWILSLVVLVFFGVKIPVFPFYVWLPEAHVESNTEMSILLASIILKFGVFGLLRVGYWIDSSYLHSVSFIVLSVCLVGLVHSSVSSIHHLDLKKLIAYSSIVHMQFGLLGILSNDYLGLYTVVLGSLVHGIVSICLFYTIGAASESVGTRHIAFIHSGVTLTPLLSLFGFITVLLNISSPLSIGSIVEFLTLSVYTQFGYVVLSIGSMCAIWFCTLFSLILLYRVFMNDSNWYHNDTVDMSLLESICMLVMCLLLVFAVILI